MSNQKNVYVMNSAPTTAYDGQFWVCTSSDPPLVKVYDLTNARWMEYHALYYEAVTSGQMPAATPVTNGALAVAYDTEQSSTTLFAYANGSWRDMGGALTQVYPAGSVTSKGTLAVGSSSVNILGGIVNLVSGVTSTVKQINITPSESGATIAAFGGGFFTSPTADVTLTLHIDDTEVDTTSGTWAVNSGDAVFGVTYSLAGYRDGMADTSTPIYVKALMWNVAYSGINMINMGTAVGAVEVTT